MCPDVGSYQIWGAFNLSVSANVLLGKKLDFLGLSGQVQCKVLFFFFLPQIKRHISVSLYIFFPLPLLSSVGIRVAYKLGRL